MPETTRRVNVTLTFATDVDEDRVMLRIANDLPDDLSAALKSTNVHAFDLAEDGPGEPVAYLVIADDGIQVATDDLDAASSAASACQGLIAELPIVADHRKETDR